eukprot:gene14907-10658_t
MTYCFFEPLEILKLGAASPSAPERLLFNSQDVGKFLRIWWSRYNRFYYGRVVAFDGQKGTHTITYEDKDTRVYDMRSKDYEIVMVPPEVKKQVVGLQDAAAAQIAAVWHRTKGVHLAAKDEAMSSANVAQKQETAAQTSSRDYIPRPLPHLAFNGTARLFEASMLPEESEHTSIVDEGILVSFFEGSIVPWAVAEEKMAIIS